MKKGDKHPHKSHSPSLETRKKISEAHKGKPGTRLGCKLSNETKLKMSLARRGIKFTDEHRRKLSEAQKRIKNRPIQPKGFRHSEESKRKIGDSQRGEKHHNWQGGITFEEYGINWTETLKRSIRERDRYTCKMCNQQQTNKTFSVHHIDYDKKNCDPKNLITLCNNCHVKTNHRRMYWINYFNNLL